MREEGVTRESERMLTSLAMKFRCHLPGVTMLDMLTMLHGPHLNFTPKEDSLSFLSPWLLPHPS